MRLYVWIPRGKQYDLPTITREHKTGECLRIMRLSRCVTPYGMQRQAAGTTRRTTWVVFPMANPHARVRDFISRLVHLCPREPDIVSLARTVKIRMPIIPNSNVCIPARMHVYISLWRFCGNWNITTDHHRVIPFKNKTHQSKYWNFRLTISIYALLDKTAYLIIISKIRRSS